MYIITIFAGVFLYGRCLFYALDVVGNKRIDEVAVEEEGMKENHREVNYNRFES